MFQTVTPTIKDHFDASNIAVMKDLRERVDVYFEQSGLTRHATPGMVLKVAFFLLGAAGLIALLSTGVLPPAWALLVCLVLGSFVAGIGFNVGHDAIHGAFSSKAWVNRMLGHSFDVIGANSVTWSKAHNIIHHTYTNIPGIDTDLEPGPWLRFYPRANPWWIHRFQHFYAPLLYSLTSIVWILNKDLSEVLRADFRTGKRHSAGEIASVLAWKVVHLTLFLGPPLAFSGYPVWQIAVGYLAMHAVAGETLAIVFQLAHVVEQVEFPPKDGSKRRYPWAEHQLRTTADFSPDSAVVAFYCGGLNRQIEHHLFARICHVHYPALSVIVKEVAKKHGLPYFENTSFFSALASHFRLMKRFGRANGAELSGLQSGQPGGASASAVGS